MRSMTKTAAIAGLMAVLHYPSASAAVLVAENELKVAQGTTAPAPAAVSEQANGTQCGAPRPFDRQPVAADAPRARAGFALDVLAALSSNSPNVSVSPFGLSAVLSTLDLGATARMKKAIASTLKIGSAPGRMEDLRRESRLINLASARDPARLASFNGIFVDHRLALKSGVADLAKADGDVELQAVDFSSQAGIDGVNGLLSKKTGGRVKSILDPGASPLLVVANALVFKDCWKAPFDKSQTANKPFARADGSKSEVPTMSVVSDSIGYRAKGRFLAVDLPYLDENFSLTLVTTQKESAKIEGFRGVASLLAGINFTEARVTLSLPKFGGVADNDLLDTLSALGLKSGLASTNQLPGFADNLVVSRVRQKTWLSVDETGTEAAAVTAASAERSAAEPTSVKVSFDKPFVYALRYRPTGAILMAGYVGDPGEMKSGKKE